MNYILIALIWAGYCSLHSYLISIRFSEFMKRLLKDYYAFYRVFYVAVSVLLFIPAIQYTAKLQSDVILTYTPPWSVIRYVLMIGSLIIFFKAFFFDYDSLHFLGIRQIMDFRKTDDSRSGEGIKMKGLLGVVRHPMYSSLILFLWCQTFRVSDIVANLVLTIYVIIGTILEERKLVLEFGDAYRKYMKEVPMLIPFVKFNRGNNI